MTIKLNIVAYDIIDFIGLLIARADLALFLYWHFVMIEPWT